MGQRNFNRYAVSHAGAVGLMQVMPFWPENLGMRRHQLVKVSENIRMGCAIFRFYLKRENNNIARALARYNGSVGKRWYSDKVIDQWTRWNGADDLGQSGDPGGGGVGRIEQHLVAHLHLVAEKVARLVVADALPCRAAVTLEICPTSNLLTKALADEDAVRETFHRFVEHKVPFTIATDGPEMMRTHLRDEFELLHRIGALDEEGLARANARGHAAAFVGRAER